MAELAGAPPVAAGRVADLSLNGAAAFLAVTDTRFVWSLAVRPDIVLDMAFDKIVEVGERDGAMKLTARDAAYAAMLRDPSNPYGETDAIFFFGDQDDIREALVEGVENHSPTLTPWRDGIARFRDAATSAVAGWATCPVCDVTFSERVDHAVKCPDCGRVFCDAGYQPVVSDIPEFHGRIEGVKEYLPLLADLDAVTRTRPYIIRPREMAAGPLVLTDLRLESRAFRC